MAAYFQLNCSVLRGPIVNKMCGPPPTLFHVLWKTFIVILYLTTQTSLFVSEDTPLWRIHSRPFSAPKLTQIVEALSTAFKGKARSRFDWWWLILASTTPTSNDLIRCFQLCWCYIRHLLTALGAWRCAPVILENGGWGEIRAASRPKWNCLNFDNYFSLTCCLFTSCYWKFEQRRDSFGDQVKPRSAVHSWCFCGSVL